MLAAAVAETGVVGKPGSAVVERAEIASEQLDAVPSRHVDLLRDDHGRFTGAYPGGTDRCLAGSARRACVRGHDA